MLVNIFSALQQIATVDPYKALDKKKEIHFLKDLLNFATLNNTRLKSLIHHIHIVQRNPLSFYPINLSHGRNTLNPLLVTQTGLVL
jgi:hypothetical protein